MDRAVFAKVIKDIGLGLFLWIAFSCSPEKMEEYVPVYQAGAYVPLIHKKCEIDVQGFHQSGSSYYKVQTVKAREVDADNGAEEGNSSYPANEEGLSEQYQVSDLSDSKLSAQEGQPTEGEDTCDNQGRDDSTLFQPDNEEDCLSVAQIKSDLLDNMNIWFGNFHSHSFNSDGDGTPGEGFLWARDMAGYDFYALTDHARMIEENEWLDAGIQADFYNQDHVFVAIRGFEWTHQHGHINGFDTSEYADSNTYTSIGAFYEWLDSNSVLAQFNHPSKQSNLFNHLILDPLLRDNIFAIETGNSHLGNNDEIYLEYYHKALDKGWRVAPTCNQDNHKLITNSHRSVAIAPMLTREDIIDAMWARRIYSTDDPNLQLIFKLGEHWMGSEVSQAGETVTFSVLIDDDEPITAIELKSNNGTTVDKVIPPRGTTTVFWEPQIQADGDYYYVQISTVDLRDDDGPNQIAVSAPIWFY